jgi:circadian clock protein KaiB
VTRKSQNATAAFERAATSRAAPRLALRLFVAGTTPRSLRAIVNLRSLCEQHFAAHYDLEVVDVYQQAFLAREHQILVVPTLIRYLPAPARRIVGDLSNTEVVLAALHNTVPNAPSHAKKPEQKNNERDR